MKILIQTLVIILMCGTAYADWLRTPTNVNNTTYFQNLHYVRNHDALVRVGSTLFALAPYHSGGRATIWRSTDEGNTWSAMTVASSGNDYITTIDATPMIRGADDYVYFFGRTSTHLQMTKFLGTATTLPDPVNMVAIGAYSHGGYHSMSATVDSEGRLFVNASQTVATDQDDMLQTVSDDAGVTWSTLNTVFPSDSNDSFYTGNCAVSEDDDVSCIAGSYQDDPREIRFNRSTDHGATWGTSSLLYSGVMANPHILAKGDNELFVFAQSEDDPTPGRGLVMNHSDDSGATWEGWTLAEGTCNYFDPTAAIDTEGNLYVAGRRDNGLGTVGTQCGDSSYSTVMRSTDNGDSWTPVIWTNDLERAGSMTRLRYQTWHTGGGQLEWLWMNYDDSGSTAPTMYNSNEDVDIATPTSTPVDPGTGPYISGVSGTFENGETITISGSRLGTKATAAPIIASYDDATSANNWSTNPTYGNVEPTTFGWWIRSDNGSSEFTNTNTRNPLYQSSYTYTYEASSLYENIRVTHDVVEPDMYVSWWMYRDNDILDLSGTEMNSKFMRISTSNTTTANIVWSVVDDEAPVSVDIYKSYGGGDYMGSDSGWSIDYTAPVCASTRGVLTQWSPQSKTTSCMPVMRQWEHYEVWIRYSSGNDIADAEILMMKDGATFARTSGAMMGESGQTQTLRLPHIGIVSGGRNNAYNEYIDQVYIDNTPAHVYLSDSATASWPDIPAFNSSEVQVPAAWTETGITFTLNQGAFADNSTVYLYVVDEDGVANTAGYPITLGDSGSTTAVNGACNTTTWAQSYVDTCPSTNLCSSGNAGTVTNDSDSCDVICYGTGGGTNDVCTAAYSETVDPECAPTHRNLCTVDDCETDGEGYWYNDTCNATAEVTGTITAYSLLDGSVIPYKQSSVLQLTNLNVTPTTQLGLAFPTSYTEYYDKLSDAGIGIVRLEAAWSFIEPTKGSWSWNLDARVITLQTLGIEPFITLEGDADWAITTESAAAVLNGIPIDDADWIEFCRVVAERYDGDGVDDAPGLLAPVKYFQVANEWGGDDNTAGGWYGTSAELITYINQAYTAIKGAYPSATFVLGGLASRRIDAAVNIEGIATYPVNMEVRTDGEITGVTPLTEAQLTSQTYRDHVDMLYSVISSTNYDVAAGHFYGLSERNQYRVDWLQQAGIGTKPIVVTEGGGPSMLYSDVFGEYEPEDHFRAVLGHNLSSLSEGIDIFLWTRFAEYEGDSVTFANQKTPLFDVSVAAKPGYSAYYLLAKALENATSVTHLGTDHMYQITLDDGESLFIGWVGDGEADEAWMLSVPTDLENYDILRVTDIAPGTYTITGLDGITTPNKTSNPFVVGKNLDALY